MVCIHCMTFNHAPYVADAMDGFCMQQTNFPYVAVIVDDASTDGEPEVIMTYLQKYFDIENRTSKYNEETDDYVMTFARHKQNHNCFFAVYLLKYNHFSIKKEKESYFKEFIDNATYVAYCEGDDFWIANDKLQIQVDFLQNNPKYVMCYSGFINVDDNGRKIYREKYEKLMHKSTSGDILILLLETNFILTCTTIFRKHIFQNYINYHFRFRHDYTLFLYAAVKGYCYFFPEKLSAYRKTPTGAMATMREDYGKKFHETRLFFYNTIFEDNYIDKKRISNDIKKKIATICYLEDSKEFEQEYRRVLRHKALWKYIPILLLKKIYIKTTK